MPTEETKTVDEQILGSLRSMNETLDATQGSIAEANKRSEAIEERMTALENGVRVAETVGLTEEETQRFSLSRAYKGIHGGDWNGAEFEREAIDEAHKIRAQSTATDAGGGFLLPTEVSNRIIEPTKRKAILGRAGATFMEGMRGTFNLPKAATAELQDRTDGAAVSDQSANWTYSQVQLTANYSGELVKVSRSLLQQDVPAADAFIEGQLQKAVMRKVDAIGLAVIQGLTATTDTIAAPAAAGDKLSPRMLQRAWTLLQNANVMDADTKLALIANPLVKWHVLDGASYSAATPWIPYANDAALGAALGAEVLATTFFNDDSASNGEAVLGAFEHLVIALFGEGIEIASSEHADFNDNLVNFRALLAVDAASIHDTAFIHWDNLGDA
jgi:HK97 family phage major capsid protein